MPKLHVLILLSLTLLVASSAAGQAVGLEFQVNTHTTNDQKDPDVAKDTLGNFIVVWESTDQDGDGRGVFGQRYDSSGVEVGGEFQVNSYTTGHQDQPSVAIGSDSFLVVWTSQDQGGPYGEIWAQRYDTDGMEIGSEFHVNSTTENSQYKPHVTHGSAGDFLVVWGSAYDEVRGQRFDSAGMAQGIELEISSLGAGTRALDAGMDSGGNFVVVWSEYIGPYSYLRRFDSLGTAMGSTFLIQDSIDPAVAVHPEGDFVIAYRTYYDAEIRARRFDSGGTALGDELSVNTYTTGSQFGPSVAMDSDRNFIVAWSSGSRFTTPGPDGAGASVAAQRFTSGGDPWGTEIVVNTYTTGDQRHAGVAVAPDGRFVVAWTSGDESNTGPDGSGTSVQAQRFDPGLIFADGFESGDTSLWSAMVPMS